MTTTEEKVAIIYCNVDKLYYIQRNGEDIHHQQTRPSQTDIIEAIKSDNWKARFDEMRDGKKVRVSERIYYHMLGSVPPLKYTPSGFICGEAYSGDVYYHFWKEDSIIYGQLKQVK